MLQQTPYRVRPLPFGDLILYATVFLTYVLGSMGLAQLIKQDNPILQLMILTLSNAFIIGGGALVVNYVRGTFHVRRSGLWPIRINWKWLLVACIAWATLLPIRVLLGYMAAQWFEGGLDSLNHRAQLLMVRMTFTWPGAVTGLLGVGILAPIGEELLFRGGIFGWLRSRLSVWPAAVLSGAVFGMAHYDSLAVAVASFIMGITLAWLYEKSHSLWTPILMHVLNNSATMLVIQALLFIQAFYPQLLKSHTGV